MEKKWKCIVTGDAICITECHECHTQSCPVNTGFVKEPPVIQNEASDDKADNN